MEMLRKARRISRLASRTGHHWLYGDSATGSGTSEDGSALFSDEAWARHGRSHCLGALRHCGAEAEFPVSYSRMACSGECNGVHLVWGSSTGPRSVPAKRAVHYWLAPEVAMIPLVSMRSRQNLNVFISSPSDIVTEREAARDVVRTVNDGVARRLGFTLTYKGWDVMHPRDMTPEQWMKLQLRDCDFFLMILWRRYGTPPSETSSCGSGTVREFEIALDLRERENRPEIAVYFGSIEKHLREDPGEQLKQVLAFRERLEQKHKPLYKEYCSTEGFRDEFRANLTDWLLTLWESRPDEKQQILQRFFALGAPPDQKPEAQIVYPLLEEKQTDITHLLPYMVLEDFQAMHKVTKCLNSIGHAQVHTIMDELYRDPNAGHRAARWNKIFLCSRNLSGQRYLDRIRHSGLDCQFEVHHPHPGEPNERSIKWTNKHGSI